jgi:choline-phosphate cytidylyltransferase
VSWLKKNELEIKRHVVELRDTIRSNWSTTGQELGKELRQLWQNSRPSSPGRMSMDSRSDMNSPSLGRGEGNGSIFFGGGRNRLDIPARPDSPGVGRSEDFATGYSLGLIGGVRSWVSFDPY